ncbi:hypothetical protein [Actinomadura violacea]|uniref:Uncharacterized protein n=1 Tax=Actinomadura violacea TaxID=2819934 RepID=A0ABS3S7Y1_9ACTN|nr:hypothetical protein [Actinomadura violacea]MBO2464991.1 hypothetical protein [Actinomadura violacea]
MPRRAHADEPPEGAAAGPDREAAVEPCLRGPDGCQGEVSGRESFGGTGQMIYECAAHMARSWNRELELRRRYPVLPPGDWDPMDAGERWDPE